MLDLNACKNIVKNEIGPENVINKSFDCGSFYWFSAKRKNGDLIYNSGGWRVDKSSGKVSFIHFTDPDFKMVRSGKEV